jgi:hypothetical protein
MAQVEYWKCRKLAGPQYVSIADHAFEIVSVRCDLSACVATAYDVPNCSPLCSSAFEWHCRSSPLAALMTILFPKVLSLVDTMDILAPTGASSTLHTKDVHKE